MSNDLYDFVASENDKYSWYIKVKNGKWAGSVFKYDVVTLGTPNTDGTLPFSFEYTMFANPHNADTSKDSEFTVFASKILIEVIQEHGEEMLTGSDRKKKYLDKGENDKTKN